MPCIKSGNTIVCYNGQYKYKFDGKEYYFEMTYSGPWPLKKDGDPTRRFPSMREKFWKMFAEFWALSDEEKQKYEV